MDSFRLNKSTMELEKVKIVRKNRFMNNTVITATPIVIMQDNNTCYSLRDNNDLKYFFNRLKENILKKYNAYYHTDLTINNDLFSDFELSKEVCLNLNHGLDEFKMIGSRWKFKFNDEIMHNHKLLKFIYDTGLGEKNSLGFGFLNFIK